jgi:hypothetical protein
VRFVSPPTDHRKLYATDEHATLLQHMQTEYKM